MEGLTGSEIENLRQDLQNQHDLIEIHRAIAADLRRRLDGALTPPTSIAKKSRLRDDVPIETFRRALRRAGGNMSAVYMPQKMGRYMCDNQAIQHTGDHAELGKIQGAYLSGDVFDQEAVCLS